ncbi:hypothetical protein GCM10028791_04350 [Echinicola sediminis]
MNEKKIKRWLGATLIMLMAFTVLNPKAAKADQGFGVSFQVFYDELTPYGDWVNDPRYGYIWLPYVDRGFHPYGTNGHWVMTEFGNTWVSNYDWGWAPFHYGRWFYDNHYGWAWVPGYEWGPAWVNWRTGGGYYGWAPLAPGLSISVGINIPSFHWVFVPRRRFTHRHVYRYYAPRRNIVNIYNHTTVINNTVVYNNNRYVAGPGRREIERYSRSRVPVYKVNNSRRPGRAQVSRESLSVYRPQVRATSSRQNQQARPSRILSPERARTSRSEAVRGNNSTTGRSYSTNGRSAAERGTSSRTPRVAQPNRSSNPSRANSSVRSSGSNNNPVKAVPYQRNSNSRYSGSRQQTKSDQPAYRTRSTQKSSTPNVRQSNRNSTNRVTTPSRSRVNTKSSQPNVRSRPAVSNRNTSSRVSKSSPAVKSRSQSASSSRRSGSSRSRGNN